MMSFRSPRFLAFLALYLVQILGRSNAYKEYDWYYDVGRPSSSLTPQRAKCKKDLLLIVDTSFSIGKHSFNSDVKPFLQRLVTDEILNVGRDGTQVALIIFSERERTKLLLNFGDIYDADALSTYIDSLVWNKVSGDRTRTDIALEIANEKVFPTTNPTNNRPDIADVVVLITDGAPRGKRNTKANAIKYAQHLKDKGVLVVGAGVGPSREKFKYVLEELASSKEYVLEADFEDMDQILARLVASSCIVPGELCRGTVFNSKAQVCCYGTIHTRKPGYDCCGPVYFDSYSQKCCPNANLFSRQDACPRE